MKLEVGKRYKFEIKENNGIIELDQKINDQEVILLHYSKSGDDFIGLSVHEDYSSEFEFVTATIKRKIEDYYIFSRSCIVYALELENINFE